MKRLSSMLAVFLALPASAWADTVVLAPPIAGKGVTAQQVQDLFGLMSSELEFMPGVDEVAELDPAPPSLTSTCLDSERCLASLAKAGGGTTLIAGEISKVGSDLVAEMIYFDAATGTVLRRSEWILTPEPAALVEQVPANLRALVTGQTAAQKKAEQTLDGVDFGGDEEDDVRFDEPKPAPAPAPAPAPRPVSKPVAPPPPPPPPPPAPVEDAFDPDAFDFSSDADDISYGGAAPVAEPRRDDPPPTPPTLRRDPPPPTRTTSSRPPEEDLDDVYVPPPPRREPAPSFDEDEDEPPRPSSSSSRTASSSASKKSESGYRRIYVPVRAGYSSYGWYGAASPGQGILFHFLTIDAEFQVRVVGGLTVLVGSGAWVVRRQAPPSQAALCPGGVCTSAIIPLRFGVLYRIDAKKLQPYVGVDGMAMQYFQPVDTNNQPTGPAQWAGGARLRLGTDVMFSKNVGLEVDVAMGFLSGGSWPQVDYRLPTFGFAPEVSGGLVFAF